MDENPYKATVHLDEGVPSRRNRFGFLIMGTVGGAAVGFALAGAVMLAYGPPRLFDPIYPYIPVTCVAPMACVGAVAGAIWEYCTRD